MSGIFNVSAIRFPAIIPPHDTQVDINDILPLRHSPEYSEMDVPPSYNPPSYKHVLKTYIKKQKYVRGRILDSQIRHVLDLFFIENIIAYDISGYWIPGNTSSSSQPYYTIGNGNGSGNGSGNSSSDRLVAGPDLEPAVLQIRKNNDEWILIVIPLDDDGNVKGRITCQVYNGDEHMVYLSTITQINLERNQILSINNYNINYGNGQKLQNIPKLFQIDIIGRGFIIVEYLSTFNNVTILKNGKFYNPSRVRDTTARPVPIIRYAYEYFLSLQKMLLRNIIMY